MHARYVISGLSGLLFGLGLMISDMANPARVLAFLDVATMADGTWDPTLMFVMGGAMTVSSIAWIISWRRASNLWGGPLPPPAAAPIDRRLIAGSALFGIGWGLVGVCPGPSLVALFLHPPATIIFAVSMLTGMVAFALTDGVMRRAPA
ncbi:DUF6691 family protein [Rhodovulum sp. DZ06]|uniref:DUF6691 family protein n=1 Tax=Rhodovulum sp. DZ06 TaxID=3425126 RepID=UPI003D33926E